MFYWWVAALYEICMSSVAHTHLYLIGLGVMIPEHITQEATRAMSRCALLYSIVQERADVWLPPNSRGTIEVVNALTKWYVEGSLRDENYERAALGIIESLSGERSIGYVTYGNPMTYDRVAQNLLEYCEERDLNAQIIPGISSFDTILCDLRRDMAPGIQLYEASWMVACQVQPRSDVPLLLMQVGAFGSLRAHYTKRKDGKSLTELVDWLSEVYPSSHEVILTRSTGHLDQAASICQVPLGQLVNVSADDLSGASLYIPALRKALPDQDILRRMCST